MKLGAYPNQYKDFWSQVQQEIQLTATPQTKTLPGVTLDGLPDGAIINKASAMLKFRILENTNAAENGLDGATMPDTSQVIQVADDTPGTYYDAINFVNSQLTIPATTRDGGDVLIGSINISGSGKVDKNDGYLFRWLLAKAKQNNLHLHDVQVGLRVWFAT